MNEKPLVEALREAPLFVDLNEEQLAWFATNAEELKFAAGDLINSEGDPAEWLVVILDGEVRVQRERAGPDAPAFISRAGGMTGLLPFSRMTHIPAMVRALAPTRVARLHKQKFPEMFERIPQLLPRLVSVMADRIREVSRLDQQRDKLMALGKLSAGLAHELNNPASAARRSAQRMRTAMSQLREANARLDRMSVSQEQRLYLAEFEQATLERLPGLAPLDSLEQSDREEAMTGWLEAHRVEDAWKLSASLVEAGLDPAALEAVAAKFDGPVLAGVLQRIAVASETERLVREIENSTGRISDLVQAIKEYSYMDQGSEQEIDIHRGIESTLTMMNFRLKNGVQVVREFDPSLPRLCAHGSELNQVWTNLICNAVDAMHGIGQLRIRTSKELDRALIEFIDSGSGIPDEIKDRIFEPFFSTKGVGEGTGLGLDTVYRIVRSHHGQVKVDSRPGRTRFQIWLPFHTPEEAKA